MSREDNDDFMGTPACKEYIRIAAATRKFSLHCDQRGGHLHHRGKLPDGTVIWWGLRRK